MVSGTGLGGGGGSNGSSGGREVCVMEESLGDGDEGVQVVGRCGWCVQVRGIIPQISSGRVRDKVGEILTRSSDGVDLVERS